MGKSLVIVESPAKAKTINRYLGADFIVKASMGHIRDLPRSELGINIEEGFKPKYVGIRDRAKVLKELKELAGKADRVLLAADPDREGEAICWHLARALKPLNENIYRIMFNEITADAVKNALAEARAVDQNRFEAQQARRVLDRLVGYKLSPLLWKKVQKGLSAGRVQSVAVRLVCDRENEIEAFKPDEFWIIRVLLQAEASSLFFAKLKKIDGKKAKVTNGEQAGALAAEFKAGTYKVKDLKKTTHNRNPSPPFTTSTLQQEASRKLSYAAKRTMYLAQKLYEGVDVKDRDRVGLITYMRTDSMRMSQGAIDAIREYVKTRYGADYIPAKARVFKSKKGSQDAHEAIRPTDMTLTPEAMKNSLDRDQLRLYKLIWDRAVACQMSPAKIDRVELEVDCNDRYIFSAQDEHISFDGFIRCYTEGKDDVPKADDDPKKEGVVKVPTGMKPGIPLTLNKVDSKQEFTKPPPRFTEATLVKTLDEKGVGRPSTYAQILSTIRERHYVEINLKKYFPTKLGRVVNNLLVDNFPRILDIGFTAQMENELDRIEEGALKWDVSVEGFYGEFKKNLDSAAENMKDVRGEINRTDIVCDKCGELMVIRIGRGKRRFLGCSAYPKCRNTMPLDEESAKNGIVKAAPVVKASEPIKTSLICEKCGGGMVIRKGRFGDFLACSNYPKCKNSGSLPIDEPCHQDGCEGNLVPKSVRKGRMRIEFYGCDKYPDCDFTLSGRGTLTECPKCGKQTTLRRKSKDGRITYLCPVKTCSHEWAEEKEEDK